MTGLWTERCSTERNTGGGGATEQHAVGKRILKLPHCNFLHNIHNTQKTVLHAWAGGSTWHRAAPPFKDSIQDTARQAKSRLITLYCNDIAWLPGSCQARCMLITLLYLIPWYVWHSYTCAHNVTPATNHSVFLFRWKQGWWEMKGKERRTSHDSRLWKRAVTQWSNTLDVKNNSFWAFNKSLSTLNYIFQKFT